jgi:hypothetical protein
VLRQREEWIRFSYSNEDTKDEEGRQGWVVDRRPNMVPSAPCPRMTAQHVAVDEVLPAGRHHLCHLGLTRGTGRTRRRNIRASTSRMGGSRRYILIPCTADTLYNLWTTTFYQSYNRRWYNDYHHHNSLLSSSHYHRRIQSFS